MDWFRRQKVRNAVLQNLSDFEGGDDDDDFDLLESLQSVEGALGAESAADSVSREQILLVIESRDRRAARRVNGKPSCCVTGRNSMLPRPRSHGLL
jgi:hypothetical protein